MDTEKEQQRELLGKTREVIQIEKALNKTLAKVEPWLLDAKVNPHRKRVRPIPTTMSEAETILMIARALSSRTSAPAGWTPVAPITNFATPNPLPNQLRGGALATLQLERAKKAESDRKKESNARAKQELASGQDVTMNDATKPHAPGIDASAARHQQQRPSTANYAAQQPKQRVSMNLSDSSSSEDEDD